MKKRWLTLGSAFLITSALFFTSCQKEDVESGVTNSYTSTQDNSDAEKKFDDVFNTVSKELQEEQDDSEKRKDVRVSAESPAYPTITLNTSEKKLTIDYGTEGITDIYQVTRKGKIIVEYTGRYIDQGTVITTTLEDYYVDGDKVEGTKVVTNKGEIEGKKTFEIKVTDGKITYTDGKVATWNSNRTRVLEDEGKALVPFDETYKIYGTADGVNREGLAYTMEVKESEALYVDLSCWVTTRLPESGILSISPEGLQTRSIDYGTIGECDRAVKVSIGTFSVNLSL